MKEEMKELDVALPRDATVGDLLAALRKVEKWFGEFPDTGSKYADGTPLSYGYCYGSNGERDYMRRVARQAIVSYEEREAATRASTASSDIVPLLKRYDALTSDDDVVLVAIQVLRTAVAEIERLRARAALAEKA